MNQTTIDQSLYHYTDIYGLLGILENKEIWATDIHFLNDSTELTHGKTLAEKRLESLVKSNTVENNITNWIVKNLFETLLSVAPQNLENRDIYIASFTTARDNLRQWMSYCPPNGGYAISIKKSNLIQKKHKSNSEGNIVYRLVDVCYGEEKLLKILDISKLKKTAGSLVKNHQTDDALMKISLDIINDILFQCCAIKRPEFSDEKEARLVIQSCPEKIHPINFRAKSGIPLPYFKFKISPEDIEEIIIGPSANKELAKISLESIKRKFGLTYKVSESECTLRQF